MSFFVKPYVGSAFTILNGHKGWIKNLPNLTSFGYWAHLSNTALIIYLTTIIIKRIGSKLGIMYGLCTVHKYNSSTNNISPFRPILSAIGITTYSLAKLLVPILKEVNILWIYYKGFIFFLQGNQRSGFLTVYGFVWHSVTLY